MGWTPKGVEVLSQQADGTPEKEEGSPDDNGGDRDRQIHDDVEGASAPEPVLRQDEGGEGAEPPVDGGGDERHDDGESNRELGLGLQRGVEERQWSSPQGEHIDREERHQEERQKDREQDRRGKCGARLHRASSSPVHVPT